MIDTTGMTRDPKNEGHVLCWATFRSEPWHLGGVFATKEEALTKREELGDAYRVAFGSHKVGSDDFIGHGI